MTGQIVTLQPPDQTVFEKYGQLVTPPVVAGERQFYSAALHTRNDASELVLHVNHVEHLALPILVSRIERHPHAAQCFFPLDVLRYVVLVMPSDGAGRPCPDQALAFLMPGTTGVIFNPGVWHLGATVLDRPGHFTVLMWRGESIQDDEFQTISPMTLTSQT